MILKSAAITRCRLTDRTSGSSRTTDVNLTEPRWVRAVEIRPSTPAGRRIFHHVLAQSDPGRDPEQLGNLKLVAPTATITTAAEAQ